MAEITKLSDAKKLAEDIIKKSDDAKSENKNIFESIMDSVGSIDSDIGGFDELSAILALEDDKFKVIAPIFLQTLEKSYNNVNDRLLMVKALNASGANLEDLKEEFNLISESIDEQLVDFSQTKKDFLKQLIALTYNAVAETEGIAKKVIQIPIEVLNNDIKIPEYMTDGAAGMDVYATEDYDILPGETKIIKTGIKMAIPLGYAVLVQARSGLSARTHLRIANSVGLIDSDYRDEIGVIMENNESFITGGELDTEGRLVNIQYGKVCHIEKGERIAQLRLVETPKACFYNVENVSIIGNNRGGGYGSTGIK